MTDCLSESSIPICLPDILLALCESNYYICNKINGAMAREVNPFVVTGKIEPKYFCDRVSESARIVKSVTNGNNLVLISPRRMGKQDLYGSVTICLKSRMSIIPSSWIFCIPQVWKNLRMFLEKRYLRHFSRSAEKWQFRSCRHWNQ